MEIFVIREGQQTGPFNEDNVQKLLKSGGLGADAMGWRKGLPGWLPLGEVLKPGSERPTTPPPAPGLSGIRAAGENASQPATNKQKALLKFIGASFEQDITKQEAAEGISEALENPKLTPRFNKWGEEKLRLHPDFFQDELDYRRATRVTRFVELCETDGADAVKDVSKAHVQVLMESLDKTRPRWDADPDTALWDGLFPAIAEYFPQLIQEGWQDRLKPTYKGSRRPTTSSIIAPEQPPSATQAAFRGIAYGVALLGAILGGIHLLSNEADTVPASLPAAAPATPITEPLPAVPVLAQEPPVREPVIAAVSAPTPPAPTDVPVPVGATPSAPPSNPQNPPASPPQPTAMDLTPTAPSTPIVAPTATAPSARNIVTIVKPVAVQLQFGKVTLNAGTKMRLIGVEGQNVRVNFNNNVILVPLNATDTDPNAPVPVPVTAPIGQVPATPMPAPVIPGAPKPSSDF